MSPAGLIIRRLPCPKRSKDRQETDLLTLGKLPAIENWLAAFSGAAKTQQQRDSRWGEGGVGGRGGNKILSDVSHVLNLTGENIASVWALIGAFGSEAMIAPSSILSTLLPIKKEEGKKEERLFTNEFSEDIQGSLSLAT